jgi:hypothetical protein
MLNEQQKRMFTVKRNNMCIRNMMLKGICYCKKYGNGIVLKGNYLKPIIIFDKNK